MSTTLSSLPRVFDVYDQARLLEGAEVDLMVADHGPKDGEPVLMIHGFPDSARLWRNQIPVLTKSGYRVLAPDMRGFGRSSKPEAVTSYRMSRLARDMDMVLSEAGVDSAHVVGHDWGSAVAWFMAITSPERVKSLTAISVGHPLAFKDAGMSQMARSWYMLIFQVAGVAEEWLMRDDWAAFRQWSGHATDLELWIEDLSRPGALSAALNVYRANMTAEIMTAPAPELPDVSTPVMGVWSSGDMALTESQMTGSASYVNSEFRYERIDDVSHWVPVDAPGALNELLLDHLGGQ